MILAHYNQLRYIYTALDSVLAQDWPFIELIIFDDASPDYPEETIEQYVHSHKSGNLKRVVQIVNKRNLGTVKSLNRALEEVEGEYFLFFAADDALAGTDVLSKFMDGFGRYGDDAKLIAANAKQCDVELMEKGESFLPMADHVKFGMIDAEAQFFWTSGDCIFCMGATAIRTSLLTTVGPFDERYRLIEDWPFFIKLNRTGIKVWTAPFFALLHRDNGISVSSEAGTSSSKITYMKDLQNIMEQEVFPFFPRLKTEKQDALYSWYLSKIEKLRAYGGRSKIMSRCTLSRRYDRDYYIKHYINPFEQRLIPWRWRSHRWVHRLWKAGLSIFVLLLCAVSQPQGEGLVMRSMTWISTAVRVFDGVLFALFTLCVIGFVLSAGTWVYCKLCRFICRSVRGTRGDFND